MTVDRACRDALADALAAFLSGELRRYQFQSKVVSILLEQVAGQSVRCRYLDSLYADLTYLTVALPDWEAWQHLRRHLAFLKSDLKDQHFDVPAFDHDADLPRQIRLARWHTLGLLIALGLSFWVGWWLLILAWVVSFVQLQVSMNRHNPKPDSNHRELVRRILAFHPFVNEEQWRYHEPLLEQFQLPAYDPNRFAEANNPSRLKRAAEKLGVAAAYVLLGGIVAVIYVCSLFLWPLWLVLMSFVPARNEGPNRP